MKNPVTLEEMYGNLEIVAQMTGHEKEAGTLIESLKARVAAVDEKIAPLSRSSCFMSWMPPTQPNLNTAGKFITFLISRAGDSTLAGAD